LKTIPRRHGDAGRKSRARAILRRLRREFPEAATTLHHQDPFELLIATILSAQCTDERVNRVTPALFTRYPDPASLAKAEAETVEEIIRSTGFFRMKTKNIIGCSTAIVEHHHGEVPNTMEDLTRLPGVGRKTANVLLGQYYGIAQGVVVDTHVHRLSHRLELSREKSAEGVEKDLMELFPIRDWVVLSSALILHGRKTCKARSPLCHLCVISGLCPSAHLGAG